MINNSIQKTASKEKKGKEMMEIMKQEQQTKKETASTFPSKESETTAQELTNAVTGACDASHASTGHPSQDTGNFPLSTQSDIEEVDAALAGLLASADFVIGNAANAARQLNAMLAVVNHGNGKRVKLHRAILDQLAVQEGDFINATVKNKQVILLAGVNGTGIPLKKSGYLYNTELVSSITEEFAFDFTNQSTHHLLNVSYKRWNNQVIAIITE